MPMHDAIWMLALAAAITMATKGYAVASRSLTYGRARILCCWTFVRHRFPWFEPSHPAVKTTVLESEACVVWAYTSFSRIIFSDFILFRNCLFRPYPLSFSGIVFSDFILFRNYLSRFYPFQDLSYQNRSFSGSSFSDKKVSQRIFFQIISLQEILIARLSEHTLNKCLSLFEALDHIKAGVWSSKLQQCNYSIGATGRIANSGHMRSMAPFGLQVEKPRNDQQERVQ